MMQKTMNLFSMAALAAMLSPAPAHAACENGAVICLGEETTESDNIAVQPVATETAGKIDLRDNYERMTSAQVRSALREFKGELPPGNWPLDARAGDHSANILVFAAKPAAEVQIGFLKDDGDEASLLITVLDDQGRQIRLREDQIAVFDFQDNPLPFSMSSPEFSMAVNVLIDTSGSMKSALSGVTDAVTEFMASLPSHVGCSVAGFSSQVTDLTGGYVPCPIAGSMLPQLRANGGTDLYGAMVDALDDLRRQDITGTLLLVVSDGYDGSSLTKDDVAAAKSSPIYVLWPRGYNEEGLSGVADVEAVITSQNASDGEIQAWTAGILAEVSEALIMQHTLVVQSAPTRGN